MSSDPSEDPESAVKPRVIDLEASDLTVEESAADSPAPGTAQPPPKPAGRRNLIVPVAAVLIGVAAGGWFYRAVLSSYFPTNEMSAMRARVDTLEAVSKTHGQQLAAATATVDSFAGKLASLEQLAKEMAARSEGGQETVAAIEGRLAALEENLKITDDDLARLQAGIASIKPGTGVPDTAALLGLGQRLDTLEKDVASLKSRGLDGNSSAATAALSQALADLKAKIALGASYRVELDRIGRMVPAADGLEILEAHANDGLPNAEGLAGELLALKPSLPRPAAEPSPAGESYLDSVWNTLSSVVKIRTIGETDWPALADKAAGGGLAQAIDVIDGAEGAKPIALGQWRDRAAARLKLEAALETVSQAALRQIAAMGSGQ